MEWGDASDAEAQDRSERQVTVTAADGVEDGIDDPIDEANDRPPGGVPGVGPHPGQDNLGDQQHVESAKDKINNID